MAIGGQDVEASEDLDAIRYIDEDINASGDNVEGIENSKAPDEDVIINETEMEALPFIATSRLPESSLRTKIGHFFYNHEKKTIFGRTAGNWGRLLVFYMVFHAILAGLCAVCFLGLMATIDPKVPKYTLEESLIGTTPGLAFRPSTAEDDTENNLIWYKLSDQKQFKYWTDKLDKFIEPYRMLDTVAADDNKYEKCDYNSHQKDNKVCYEDVKQWYPCTKENHYGYQNASPCVFLKLNKIYDWVPESYDNISSLPEDMPEDLKNYIGAEIKKNPFMMNTVWLSCEGEKPADRENIGPVEYIPRRGFPGYFYPYKNTAGYMNPLVAVYFKQPQIGVIINVQCRAWSKNIIHDEKEHVGAIQFQLLID